VVCWAIFLLQPLWAEATARRPNVVFILLDDLGYGDIGSYGAPDIRTPNLDRLAREGVRLTDAYSNGPVCSPTRAAFMTGRYPQRVGIEKAIGATDRMTGLSPLHVALPRMLKEQGYATAMFGKRHLGLRTEDGPNAHGFEAFFGFRAGHLDYFSHRNVTGHPDLFENTQPVVREGYMADLITDRSVEYLSRAHDKPFFLYVAFNTPHDPWQSPDQPDDIRTLSPTDQPNAEDSAKRLKLWVKGNRQVYAKMVERADEGIGRILYAIDRAGLEQDTLVIFTSDNGGERFSRNYPLFHSKGSVWEGGIHVPCILRWPGKLPAGQVSSQAAITMDLTASILAAAGTSAPETAPMDGINLMPILAGEQPVQERTFF